MVVSEQVFKSIAILGVGLIGGSLALAAKKNGAVAHVRGWGRNPARLQTAIDVGAIDTSYIDLRAALDGVDCAVIATPTQHAEKLLLETLSLADDHTVITDVASVKANLANALDKAGSGDKDKVRKVVLAHPIAGSEQSGVEAARADLFSGQRVIVTALPDTDTAAVNKIRALWRAVGAELHSMSPQLHDVVLGHSSHLPHVLAFALVDYLNALPDADAMFTFAGGGFRDFTRIAASDPVMWREIALANRDALLGALGGYQQYLQDFSNALQAVDGDTLEAIFARAKTARDAFSLRRAASNSHDAS